MSVERVCTDRSGSRYAAHMAGRLTATGKVQSAVLAVVAAFWCWWMAWRTARPAEDAAILFRYADNVAAGHGVVWNIGERPVDGATDLGFMALLAGIRSFGVGTDTAALIVNSLAFVCLTVGLFAFARRAVGPLLGFGMAALFVASPALALVSAGFGAVFFAAAVALAAVAMFTLTDRPTSRHALRLAGASVLAGVIRPEGFAIGAALILTAVVVGGRGVLRAAALAGGLVVIGAIGFVVARWLYFGFPLPNPYYKKGGGGLHADGFVASARFALSVGLVPLGSLVLIGAVLSGERRRWMAYLGCVAVLLAMWVLLANEMNRGFRFQFPVLVLTLFMIVDLAARMVPDLPTRLASMPKALRYFLPVAAVGLIAVQFAATGRATYWVGTDPPHAGIAEVLARADGDGDRVVATTEAGYVCWRSGWRCVDLWGLNDTGIAHTGYLNESELAQLKPDVIVLHAPTSPTSPSLHAAGTLLDGWEKMTDPVIRFAEGNDYVLAAILEPKQDSGFAVYVRPGQPWSDDLIADFGAIEPTIEQFYGPAVGPHPSLPTG